MEASTWQFSSYFSSYLATVLVIFVCAFYAYAKYKFSYWRKRGVKSPPTHSIFGNFKDMFLMKKSPAQVLKEIYDYADSDDPYIGFYIFHKPILLLRDPKIIKQIMITDFDIFPNRRFGSVTERDSVGLVNLLGIKHPRWKYLRTKITPVLTGQKLKSTLPEMIDGCNPMLDFIEHSKQDTEGWKMLELKDISSRYTNDILSSLAFGVSTNSFNESDITFLKAGRGLLSGLKRITIFIICFYIPELAPLILPCCKGDAKFFRAVFWDSVNTREKLGIKRNDLIDSLIGLKNGEQNPDYKFEGDNLLAQAMAFYVAGFEATSTAIAFALFELARHPEYQRQLYEEIEGVLSKTELSMEAIGDMHFLTRVVDETLRLYPPLPITDRIALQDYPIPGTDLVLEKGTSVYLSINGTNHDPNRYHEPDKFFPLRQREASNFQDSLAFGIGPRACVGQRMGYVITKIMIIAVIRNYELSYEADKDVSNSVSVFTTVDGLNVRLRKRKTQS